MTRLSLNHTELLEAALVGYEHKREQLEQKIAELRRQIGGHAVSAGSAAHSQGRRPLSAAARERIALAQKKRWAAYKSGNGNTSASKPQKRVLSAEGRAHIIAATKKRWAAFRKAQAVK